MATDFEAVGVFLNRVDAELARGAHVAVINQAMARRFWPDGDAVDRSIRLPQLVGVPPNQVAAPGSNDWLQIIGVVGDAMDRAKSH